MFVSRSRTNIFCRRETTLDSNSTHKKGEIFILDSCFSGELDPSAELQIVEMYRPLIAENGLLLSVSSIQQQQIGSNNCGLFAIASVYHALQGDNLDYVTLDEDKMRYHLTRCFNNQKLRRFPKSKEQSSQRPERFSSIVCNYCMLPLSPPRFI